MRNLNASIEPGVPHIEGELTAKAKQTRTSHVQFYELAFPDFVPTEPQGDFQVTAEGDSAPNHLFDMYAANRSGINKKAPGSYDNPFRNLLEGGPCQTKQSSQNVYLAGVFDVDRDGPDLTMVVYPKYAGQISGKDIRNVMASNNVFSNVDTLFRIHPKNGDLIKGPDGRTTAYGKKAKTLFEKQTQISVNQAWNLLYRYDSTPATTPSLGSKEQRLRVLEVYKSQATYLHNILKTLYAQNYFAPNNLNEDKNPGGVYVLSVDLDQSTANLYETMSVGESMRLKIQVKNESIELLLYKEQKIGNKAYWRAICG